MKKLKIEKFLIRLTLEIIRFFEYFAVCFTVLALFNHYWGDAPAPMQVNMLLAWLIAGGGYFLESVWRRA